MLMFQYFVFSPNGEDLIESSGCRVTDESHAIELCDAFKQARDNDSELSKLGLSIILIDTDNKANTKELFNSRGETTICA